MKCPHCGKDMEVYTQLDFEQFLTWALCKDCEWKQIVVNENP